MMIKAIEYKGDKYRDERMFVLNLTFAQIKIDDGVNLKSQELEYKWVLATYRNNLALTSFRTDKFDTKAKAIKYLKEVEPLVPLIGNGEEALSIPDNIDRWQYWLDWLKRNKLFSAITEKQHMPFWNDPRGYKNATGYMQITEIRPVTKKGEKYE